MKAKSLLTVLLCALALVGGVYAGLIMAERENGSGGVVAEEKAQEEPQEPAEFVAEKDVSSGDKYMVCLTDTQFCIYKISADGSSQLVEATDFSPAIKSAELSRFYPGVFVDTLDEARELVEDYIS